MTKPRALVLLAAHEGTPWLDEQLATVLGQVGVDVTVLVSVDRGRDGTDDGTDDGTEALVDRWARDDDRVRALPHGEHFGGAAPNFLRLVAQASYDGHDVVALADQDDVWLPDKLARAVGRLDAEGCDAYSSDVWVWDAGRTLVALTKSQPQTEWDHLFSSAGPGCTYVLRTATMVAFQRWLAGHDVSGIDYHDWLLYAWARENGHPWTIDPRPSMLYRQHGHNQLGANRGRAALRRRLHDLTGDWYVDQVARIEVALGMSDTPLDRSRSGLRQRLGVLGASRSLRRVPRDGVVVGLRLVVPRRGGAAGR